LKAFKGTWPGDDVSQTSDLISEAEKYEMKQRESPKKNLKKKLT
jgi:hypothetical protein